MPLEVVNKLIKLAAESKAYYHAYEVTGGEFLLLIAQSLELDAVRLEIGYL